MKVNASILYETAGSTQYLYGSGLKSKELIAGTLGVTVHVDQDVDPICIDAVCCFSIARQLSQIMMK